MIQYRLLLLIVVSFASCKFLEEKIDFQVKVDFQGLKKCLNQVPIENELNKRVIATINKKEFTEATLLAYAQLKKGNQLMKKCNDYLPTMDKRQMIYNYSCMKKESFQKKALNGLVVSFKTVRNCYIFFFFDCHYVEVPDDETPRQGEAATEPACQIVAAI